MPRCKNCKEKFIVKYFLQKYCMLKDGCIEAFTLELRKTQINNRVKKMKSDLISHSDYLQMLQVVFNTFIRLRDKGKPCISCGCEIKGKYDAGHYFNIGHYPALRFDETNVHAQCTQCNQWMHGNLIMYCENLPKRIGQANFEKLNLNRESILKISVPEIKEKIIEYKNKIKELKCLTNTQ